MLNDCWCWDEAQEAHQYLAQTIKEFFLPQIADITLPFGLYY